MSGPVEAFGALHPRADLVCFESSFRLSGERGGVESPNISHATLDGERTLCGRKNWATREGWHENGPDCLRCARALERRMAVSVTSTTRR